MLEFQIVSAPHLCLFITLPSTAISTFITANAEGWYSGEDESHGGPIRKHMELEIKTMYDDNAITGTRLDGK